MKERGKETNTNEGEVEEHWRLALLVVHIASGRAGFDFPRMRVRRGGFFVLWDRLTPAAGGGGGWRRGHRAGLAGRRAVYSRRKWSGRKEREVGVKSKGVR